MVDLCRFITPFITFFLLMPCTLRILQKSQKRVKFFIKRSQKQFEFFIKRSKSTFQTFKPLLLYILVDKKKTGCLSFACTYIAQLHQRFKTAVLDNFCQKMIRTDNIICMSCLFIGSISSRDNLFKAD